MSLSNRNTDSNMKLHLGIHPDVQKHTEDQEIYEVIRVENNIPLFFTDHLLRFENSLKKLDLTWTSLKHTSIKPNVPRQFTSHLYYSANKYTNINDKVQGSDFTPSRLLIAIHQLINSKTIIDGNIKISCFVNTMAECQYYIYPITSSYPTPQMYTEGVLTDLFDAERDNPNIKIGSTEVRKNANSEIKKKQIFETLLVNHNGLITEGSRSNVFFIIDNTIYTAPSEQVLEGIIRKKVLEIIKSSAIHFKMECINISQLNKVESAFLTGTSPRILPINKIGDLNLDVDNPILRELMQKLNTAIQAYKKNASTHEY